MRPSGIRSFSSPPVPCSSSSGRVSGSAPFSKRWMKDRGHQPVRSAACRSGSAASISLRRGLEKRRQLQIVAQRFDRLVDGKARRVGRDFEQNAARLAEINRAKILPVELMGRPQAEIGDELLRHRRLGRVVGGAKGDVMHRTAAEPAGQKTFRFADIDDAADRVAGAEAGKCSVTAGVAKSQNIGQHRSRACCVFDHQRDAVKTAHSVFGGNGAGAPGRLGFGAGHADQRETHAVRIGKRQHRVAEALFRRLVRDAVFDETVRPIADGARRHAECGLLCQADAAASRRRVLPGKERQDGAGMADLVAIIEMVGAGIVEVYRLLDETQPNDTRIEIKIARGLAGNRRDVMNARHGSVLHERGYESHAIILLLEAGNGASPRNRNRRLGCALAPRSKMCGKNTARLGGRVKPASAATTSKSPGANPGFPST